MNIRYEVFGECTLGNGKERYPLPNRKLKQGVSYYNRATITAKPAMEIMGRLAWLDVMALPLSAPALAAPRGLISVLKKRQLDIDQAGLILEDSRCRGRGGRGG